jgi:hypothetical protein
VSSGMPSKCGRARCGPAAGWRPSARGAAAVSACTAA